MREGENGMPVLACEKESVDVRQARACLFDYSGGAARSGRESKVNITKGVDGK